MKRRAACSFLLVACVLILAPVTGTCWPMSKKASPGKASASEAALRNYIDRVRARQDALVITPGSLWSPEGKLVRMSTSNRALRPHDLVVIVVNESLAASTDGQVKNSRASNASSSITALLGAMNSAGKLANLSGLSSASGLTAQGQSTTNSSLETTFGGEVVEVLPNGILVVQATRELTFSQQKQLIHLRGLVRPEDVSATNQVQSSVMTNLEIEVAGKGIINDSTYRQNPLVRLFQRIMVF